MSAPRDSATQGAEHHGAAGLWRAYSVEEDRQRTNVHYEQPARFFTAILGGAWHVYSCNLWETAVDETASQQHKLDLLAGLMQLRPGQRVLDVGCGWGGPLVYLAKKYGVRGVGLTLSPSQRAYAERRVLETDVDVAVCERHWKDFEDHESFDAVYTDEVTVHFHDLAAYYTKVASLLKPGGRMLNKELHFTSTRWMEITPAMVFLNEIYGETGNYRPLHEELEILDQSGFTLERLRQIPMENGYKTVDAWLRNMQTHRAELEELVGRDYYRKFRMYLRITRQIMRGPSMTLDVVVSVLDPKSNAGPARWRVAMAGAVPGTA